MKKVLLIVSALWISFGTMAQDNRCGTMENYEMLKAMDPGYEARLSNLEVLIQKQIETDPTWRTTGIVTIPVVFHILYNQNNTTQNVPLNRINAQMAVMNQDFSATNVDITNVPAVFQPFVGNTGIQFCLAVRDPQGNAHTGIIRKQTSVSSFTSNNNIKFNSSGGDDAWPSSSYLNIWVGNLGQNLLGYSQFPGGAVATDGIVLLNGTVGGPGALGTSPPYHRGRTLVHEAGHWLNLRHINGDANCGNDFVADTPVQFTLYGGCPSFPLVSCTNGPNGAMFMNYMDYTDDICMIMFTEGQALRMNSAITASRSSLLTSLGCVPTAIGLEEVIQNGISVYPNPTQGQITIENAFNALGKTTVTVFNVMGQQMKSVDFAEFSGVNYLDISEMSNGIYYVEIHTPQSNNVYRIVLDK